MRHRAKYLLTLTKAAEATDVLAKRLDITLSQRDDAVAATMRRDATRAAQSLGRAAAAVAGGGAKWQHITAGVLAGVAAAVAVGTAAAAIGVPVPAAGVIAVIAGVGVDTLARWGWVVWRRRIGAARLAAATTLPPQRLLNMSTGDLVEHVVTQVAGAGPRPTTRRDTAVSEIGVARDSWGGITRVRDCTASAWVTVCAVALLHEIADTGIARPHHPVSTDYRLPAEALDTGKQLRRIRWDLADAGVEMQTWTTDIHVGTTAAGTNASIALDATLQTLKHQLYPGGRAWWASIISVIAMPVAAIAAWWVASMWLPLPGVLAVATAAAMLPSMTIPPAAAAATRSPITRRIRKLRRPDMSINDMHAITTSWASHLANCAAQLEDLGDHIATTGGTNRQDWDTWRTVACINIGQAAAWARMAADCATDAAQDFAPTTPAPTTPAAPTQEPVNA